MTPLAWAAILLLFGLGLAMMEVFVPSGGVLGFLSICAMLAAVVLAFRAGSWVGLGFLTVATLALPTVVVLAFKFWPHTPIGRRILLDVPKGDEVLPDRERRQQLESLVGRTGRAKNLMLPSGMVAIDGKSFDAVSEGMAIDSGQRVKVVDLRGTWIVVRPCDESEPDSRATDSNDALSQPIEKLGLDPFDDSLA